MEVFITCPVFSLTEYPGFNERFLLLLRELRKQAPIGKTDREALIQSRVRNAPLDEILYRFFRFEKAVVVISGDIC